MTTLPRLGVRGWILGFTVAAALTPIVAAVPVLSSISRDATAARAAMSLRASGNNLALLLARGLYVQWREIEGLAKFASSQGINAEFRTRMDTVKAVNDRYAWLGVAETNGRVLMATDRLLEGQDVSARPWFRGGLAGPFSGDAHEALMLQKYIAPDAAEPLRLIDFAAPLRQPDGTVTGVIGSHVQWSWVRELIRSAAQANGLDIILVARDGMVLSGPPETEGRRFSVPSVMAAMQGAPSTSFETWPDGSDYLSVSVPTIGYRNLPSFGWSLVVRQKADETMAQARVVSHRLLLPMFYAAAVVIAAGAFLSRLLGRPLRAVALGVSDLAGGRLSGPPPDERGYREVAQISDAVAHLQSALDGARHTGSDDRT